MPRKKRRRKLPNGSGSITEVKSDNRYKKFKLLKPAILLPNGKYHRELVGYFETYEEAYNIAINGFKYKNDNSTPNDLFMQFTKTNAFKNKSIGTQKNHIRNLKKWEPIIYKPIKNITFNELQEKIDELEENGYIDHQTFEEKIYSRSTLKKIKYVMSEAYNQAIKNQILTVNLADMITIETPENSQGTSHFPIEFIEYCFTKTKEIPDTRKLLVNIYTGLRPIEMRSLRKKHIQFDKNTIKGMGAKTEKGKGREIVIHPRILNILKELYLETDDYILGKEMSASYFIKFFFYPLLDKLEFKEKRTPYACRKTFAYLMNHYEVDKEVIKNMLGHTSYSTSSDYYIPNDIEKAELEFKKIL